LTTPNECPKFARCNVTLCPLDIELQNRVWYSDEQYCKFTKYSKIVRWIRKQRSIVRRKTHYWQDKPITQQELVEAGKARQLPLEIIHAAQMRETKTNDD